MRTEIITHKTTTGIVYYQICKYYGGGCTQTLVFNTYDLKPKNVALCLTGRKYLGRKDKQVTTKCKAMEGTSQEMKRMHQDEFDSNED